jgi:hypothetical protein
MKQKYEKTLENLKNEYTKKMMDTKEKYESRAKKSPENEGSFFLFQTCLFFIQ